MSKVDAARFHDVLSWLTPLMARYDDFMRLRAVMADMEREGIVFFRADDGTVGTYRSNTEEKTRNGGWLVPYAIATRLLALEENKT